MQLADDKEAKVDVVKPVMRGLGVPIEVPREVRWCSPFSMGEPSWLVMPAEGGRPVVYYVSPMNQ